MRFERFNVPSYSMQQHEVKKWNGEIHRLEILSAEF
jgi:hypothetical protein